jgi:hypothetical protein
VLLQKESKLQIDKNKNKIKLAVKIILMRFFWVLQVPYDSMTPLQAALGVRQA